MAGSPSDKIGGLVFDRSNSDTAALQRAVSAGRAIWKDGSGEKHDGDERREVFR